MFLFSIAVLFISSFASVNAIQCPSNFQAINNKRCVQLLQQDSSHFDASATCEGFGGNLVSISNAIDNNALAQLLPNTQSPVWIGLKCTQNNSPQTCAWDDRSGVATYSNFLSGFPVISVGNCVYMMNSGNTVGKWISGDCSLAFNFFCEVAPTDPLVDTCSFKSGGFCYFPTLSALPEPAARFACQQECADLVSIHSADENTFVQGLFTNNLPTYIRTGGLMDTNNAFSWTDNTPFDYNNVGYSSPTFGNCMSMALKDDIIGQGKWINSHCETALPFVCKRAQGTQCGTTPSPTTSPNQCSGNHFLSNSGSFYSPNWPASYVSVQSTVCSFILDTPVGTVVQIQFPTLNLDPSATISIYNQLEDANPFNVFTGNTGSNLWYNSTTNTMKVVFRPCTSNCAQYTDLYRWQANFQPSAGGSTPLPFVTVTPNPLNPSGCNDTILVTPGVISSPNYPNLYPNYLRCSYHLSAPGGYRIKLDMADVSTEECCDIVVAHDGPFISSPEIGRISGHPAPHSVAYTSTSNSMLVTFTTDSSGQDRGFQAYFGAFTNNI